MVHNMFPKRSDFGESADMLIAEFSLIFIAVVFLPRKKQTTIGPVAETVPDLFFDINTDYEAKQCNENCG